jgi:hypothetical protein
MNSSTSSSDAPAADGQTAARWRSVLRWLAVPAVILPAVVLGALAIEKLVRLRIVYAVSIVLFGAIAAIALKVALRSRWQAHLEQPADATAMPALAPVLVPSAVSSTAPSAVPAVIEPQKSDPGASTASTP